LVSPIFPNIRREILTTRGKRSIIHVRVT